MTADIINFALKRDHKANCLRQVVQLVLDKGQTLIVGSENRRQRYEELRDMFPDAELEIVGLGVKIWKRK